MKKIVCCVAACFLFATGIAAADDYREVWECKAKEGKTLEDIQAVNSKWLKWMRDNVDKDIESAVLTAVVGNLEHFIFVDTYPSLEVWSEGKTAQDETDEMDELDAEFEETAECGETRLWRKRPTP